MGIGFATSLVTIVATKGRGEIKMGLPPNDLEKETDDFEKRMKKGKRIASIQLFLFILLLILVVIAVFYGISRIMPTASDVAGWLDNFYKITQ